MNSMSQAFIPVLVSIALLSGCSSVSTCTLPQVLEAVEVPSTMFRGVDYLGSDTDYHYFDYKRELSRDIRFRIRRSEYTPPEEWEYSRWWSKRQAFSYHGMVLDVVGENENEFRYRLAGRYYDSPADIPEPDRLRIRMVRLPSKLYAISRQARERVTPYLKHPDGILFLSPISHIGINPLLPQMGARKGVLSIEALEHLMEKRR